MSGKLGRASYKQLLAEDIAWLEDQPRTLEREHIIAIVRESERYYYEDAQDEAIRVAREHALRPLEKHEVQRVVSALVQRTENVFEAVDSILDVRKSHS